MAVAAVNPDTGQLHPSWHTDAPARAADPAQAHARKQKQKRRKMQKQSRKANR